MYVILWEYLVKAERLAEFESIYRANGMWVELFRKDKGYLGTDLLRDQNDPRRFVTMDRWVSEEAYRSFKATWQEQYNALDAQCDDLTENESLLGIFSLID
ncbi:MAG: putative quinol monooxygenase [Chloroflexota bacterium]